MLRGQLAYKGERGYSAYEIAVQHGYEGTEEQWVEDFINAENYYDKTESYNKTEVYNKSEVYNKEESDSKYILKGDFAILTGSVANTELTLGGKQLNYPDGFSQSNCTVISAMKKNHTTSVWNCYYSTYSSDEQRNEVGMMAQLFSNVIKLVTPTEYTNERTGPSSESNGYDYRVVLMKIGESND